MPNNLDGEILDLVDESTITDEIKQSDIFKEGVYEVLIEIEQCNTATPVVRATTTGTSKVKLPKLSIQLFSGDIIDWTSFWDSYEVTVHSNTSLSGIEKFSYLRSRLRGPALETILGMRMDNANYQEAVTVLKGRFGNKQQIITKHMEVLMNIDPVTSNSNIKSLRHLYDTVEAQVRSLQSSRCHFRVLWMSVIIYFNDQTSFMSSPDC